MRKSSLAQEVNARKPSVIRGAKLVIKQGLILAEWKAIAGYSVGATELEAIQTAIRDKSGQELSPAAIARVLADAGAPLRHPEVIECDARWREQHCEEPAVIQELRTVSLLDAPRTLRDLEALRLTLAPDTRSGVSRLTESVKAIREERMFVARSQTVAGKTRAESQELADWLGIWLRSPQLFADWLELRLQSPGFRQQFGRD